MFAQSVEHLDPLRVERERDRLVASVAPIFVISNFLVEKPEADRCLVRPAYPIGPLQIVNAFGASGETERRQQRQRFIEDRHYAPHAPFDFGGCGRAACFGFGIDQPKACC